MAGFTSRCKACEGTGEVAGDGGQVTQCQACLGKGRIKLTRGAAARQGIARVDILPPDPVALTRRVQEQPASLAKIDTPGITTWRAGMSHREARRHIRETVRDMTPHALLVLENLVQTGGGDSRVQREAVALALSYSMGKPGEGGSLDESSTSGLQDMLYLPHATTEERAELIALTKKIAAIAGAVKARMAQMLDNLNKSGA